MSDINLLPEIDREKEMAEKRMAQAERDRVHIELSVPKENPVKEKEKVLKEGLVEPGFWRSIKSFFKTDKDNKKEEAVKKVPVHFEDIKRPEAGKSKEEMFRELEVSKAKINQAERKEKETFTPGGVVEHKLGVSLLPTDGVIEISLGAKIGGFVGVLVVLVLIFGGIYFWFEAKVEAGMNEVLALEESSKVLVGKIDSLSEADKSAVMLKGHLTKLNLLIGNHVAADGMLTYLEQKTISEIYYTDIDLNVEERRIILKALAKNYTDAAKQVDIFEKDSEKVAFVNITELAVTEVKNEGETDKEKPEEWVSFNIEMVMKPGQVF